MKSHRRLCAICLATLALLAGTTYSDTVYLTETEALRNLFGADAKVHAARIQLSPEEKAAVERQVGKAGSSNHTVFVGLRGDKPLGFAMIWEEIGKYRPITFMVGVGLDGRVTSVQVMVYRESVGSEVRRAYWTRQFAGKGNGDMIRPDRDIRKISGATMSCDAICRGVRKVVAIVNAAVLGNATRLHQLLRQANDKTVRRQRYLMGSLCTIEANGDDRDRTAATVERAFAEMERLERVLSHYREDSELSRLNATGSIEAGADLMEFVREAIRAAEDTDAAFDPTVLPAVRLWGFLDKQFRVPSDADLGRVRELVDYRQVAVEGSRISFKKKGMAIDPGGMGKGYALERAARMIRESGISSAFLDFGSTQVAIGAPPGEEGWLVGIRNPADPERPVVTVLLKDAAISTSGQYEQCFEKDGVVYGHILDPKTCRTVSHTVSATAVCSDAGRADAMSTALVVRGEKEGLELARRLGVEAAVIPRGDPLRIEMTEGFRKLVKP